MNNTKQRELLQEFVKEPIKFGLTPEQENESFPSSVAACEDNFKIFIKVSDNKVKEAKFNGAGCAISFGATEAILRVIQDMEINKVKELLNQYTKLINGDIVEIENEYLNVFQIVQSHVSRRKCALAPVEAIRKAIN